MSNKAFLGTACIATCLLLSVGQLAAETRQETALSYIELGNKFMHQGDLDRAIGAYNIAVQFAPDFAPAFFHRALAYEARGDVVKAIMDYTNALDLAPGLTVAWYNGETSVSMKVIWMARCLTSTRQWKPIAVTLYLNPA